MPTEITRAAIYARYSSHEQDGGESIDFQLTRCKEYVEKQGWALDETNIFIDRARSGTSIHRREAFNNILTLAKTDSPPFDVVVSWHTSRFGRDSDQAIFNKVYLKRYGIDVKFVSQDIPDGHIGKLIERIYEWKDEADSILIGQNAFEGQREVTQKGFSGGGKAPYGYRRKAVSDPDGKTDKDGKPVTYSTFEVVPEQAEVVQRIFGDYADGLSYKKIAHRLNDEGIPSSRGGTWSPSAIREMLYNETYLGHRVWNRVRRNKKIRKGTKKPKPRAEWIIKENAHEALISPELWQAVEDRRGQIKKFIEDGKSNHRTYRSPHLLTEVLRCAECGGNLHITTIRTRRSPGREWRYYRCSTHVNRGSSVCTNGRSVRKETVEGRVLEILVQRLLHPDNLERLIQDVREGLEAHQDDTPDRTCRIQTAIQKADTEITNLTNAIKAGGPIDRLVAELKTCQERRGHLEAELKEIQRHVPEKLPNITQEEIVEAVEDLKSTLEYATPEERKDLISLNIRSITVPNKGKALLEPNPEGLLEKLFSVEMVTPRGVEPPSPE